MAIKHGFVSNVTDIGGPTYVQPTHWNAPHNTPPFKLHTADPAGVASFGIPSTAGPTGFEWIDNTSGGDRGVIDMTYVDNIVLGVAVSSIANGPPAGSTALRWQYMASGFPGSWYSFDATGGSGPFVSLATGNNASIYLASANGFRLSATVAISAAAKALPQPLTTRFAGYGGCGSGAAIGKIVTWGF